MRRLLPAHDSDVDPGALYERLALGAGGSPGVRANMISSIDGAASISGLSAALGGRADKLVFARLRQLADVVLVGSATVRSERYGPARLDPSAMARRRAVGLPAVPPIAVVTASCRLQWDTPFFTEAEQRPLVVTVAAADADARRRAEAVADVIVAGDQQVDLARAVVALGARGHTNILAEGGPSVIAQLAALDLLDELCLTVSPTLVGGDAARILRGPEVERRRLSPVDILEEGGFLFLRYRRIGAPAV